MKNKINSFAYFSLRCCRNFYPFCFAPVCFICFSDVFFFFFCLVQIILFIHIFYRRKKTQNFLLYIIWKLKERMMFTRLGLHKKKTKKKNYLLYVKNRAYAKFSNNTVTNSREDLPNKYSRLYIIL